jgi:hypothetical protein
MSAAALCICSATPYRVRVAFCALQEDLATVMNGRKYSFARLPRLAAMWTAQAAPFVCLYERGFSASAAVFPACSVHTRTISTAIITMAR